MVSANAALWTLKTVLTNALKLLHPYMPFITEEIYCTLHPEEDSIMISDWPVYTEEWNFAAEEAMLAHVKDLIKGTRNIRTEMDVPPSRKAKLYVTASDAAIRDIFTRVQPVYQGLAGASEVVVREGTDGIPSDAVSVVIPDAVLYIPLEDLVDFEKEKERLTKEKARLEGELKRSKAMLSNEKFLSKAPEAKVAEEKEKLAKYEQMMAEVVARLESMNK
jgi:valyl-tRNA synthetase